MLYTKKNKIKLKKYNNKPIKGGSGISLSPLEVYLKPISNKFDELYVKIQATIYKGQSSLSASSKLNEFDINFQKLNELPFKISNDYKISDIEKEYNELYNYFYNKCELYSFLKELKSLIKESNEIIKALPKTDFFYNGNELKNELKRELDDFRNSLNMPTLLRKLQEKSIMIDNLFSEISYKLDPISNLKKSFKNVLSRKKKKSCCSNYWNCGWIIRFKLFI